MREAPKTRGRGREEQGRAAGQPGEPPRDLGLADTRRPDHQDVLWCDLFRKLRRQLLPTHPVAQRNGHRAFGARLPDNELVELRNDLTRRKRADGGRRRFRKVDRHRYNSSIVTLAFV